MIPDEAASVPSAAIGIDRAEATRLIAEARRLYDIAELVQARRVVGDVDSAGLAHRSLSLLLRLLLRLHGDPIPESFAELTRRAHEVAAAESLLAEDLGPDLAVVDEMRERLIRLDTESTAADDRRYDRAFVRSEEWFGAVQAYLDQRFPPPGSRLKRHLATVLVGVLAFLVGLVAGRHQRPDSVPTGQVELPAANAGPGPALLLSTDRSVPGTATPGTTSATFSCTGCFPVETGGSGAFVWTTERAILTVRGLTPGTRYLITLRVVDAGAASRITLESADGHTDELPLHPGEVPWPRPLTASPDGTVRWSSRVKPFRRQDREPGAIDDRLLGMAIGEVRIADAPRQ